MKIRNISIILTALVVNTFVSIYIGQSSYSWLPVQAAAESQLVDNLFSFLVTLGAFIFFGVIGTLVYSMIFHRAAEYDLSDGPAIEGNITLEIVWTVIPIILVFWIAGYSYQIYVKMAIRGPMEHAHNHNMEQVQLADNVEKIEVISKQWAWVFRYPDRNVTSTELHLPVDRRVHLALTSEDVIHGFYIPAFRVKQDIIPNHNIHFEFTPIREGNYRLSDSQYSGTFFATMDANVVVESAENYQNWLENAARLKPSPAYNQASFEYERELQHPNASGWETIQPASPPIVNYHN